MKTRQRILIFSLAYYPRFVGGAEVAIKEITDRIEPGDIAFDMVTLRLDSALPREERVGNVTVYRIGPAKRDPSHGELVRFPWYLVKVLFPPLAALKALRLHRKKRYGAFWAMLSYMGFPIILMRLFGNRTPYILTLQEGDPIPHIVGRLRIRLDYPLYRAVFSCAAFFVGESTFLERWGREMGYCGQSTVIPNAVDSAFFAKPTPAETLAALREELGKREGDIYLVTTSRLVKKNAIDDVIKALALLPARVHFLVLGVGPDEAKLRELAQAAGVAARVHFLGFVKSECIPAYLHLSDIFVRPSLSEGMGNSFIEAMAAGLPVIATQEGGIADFLFDPQRNPDRAPTGRAVDPRDPEGVARAVNLYLENPDKTAEITQNAQELVFAEYDWDKIARDMRGRVFARVLREAQYEAQ